MRLEGKRTTSSRLLVSKPTAATDTRGVDKAVRPRLLRY
jgi:hypothetical protein